VSRTLKRPMFRRGGTVNDGIMTGIVDRTKKANGDFVTNIGQRTDALAPEFQSILEKYTPQTKLPLGQFGLNLASGKFAGSGALQNLIGSARDPYAQFTKADDARERAVKTGAAKLALGQAMKEAQPSNKFSQISLKAKEAFGNPNIKNPATGEPFKSYGEAYTYYSMGMSDPAKRSILGRIAVSQQNQLSNYGNNEVAAKTHAIANVVINPIITDQGKNYTGKRIKKDKKGNYKPQRTPGVYIDIERKMMVEAMPDGSIVDLPEYSQYFTQFQ
jgi:hypothetical protein